MIKVDFENKTYTCPFCEHDQAFMVYEKYLGIGSCVISEIGFYRTHPNFEQPEIPYRHSGSEMTVYSLKCSNNNCDKICVVAINKISGKQIDIFPEVTFKHYPDYIPYAIRSDYEEASMIIEKSPKASATLLRRCLQGMIRDFWKIDGKNLYEEIQQLEGKVTPQQWKAIDGLRKIGNIGAHMESDVNLIIDIDDGEAKKLQKLIEMLLDKWYIARYEEEKLCEEINEISEEKQREKIR